MLSSGQTKKQPVPKAPVQSVKADSVVTFTVAHLEAFNKILGTVPHDEYIKLTPTDVLKLWYNWIIQNQKK